MSESGKVDNRLQAAAANTDGLSLLLDSLRQKCVYLHELKEDSTQVFKKWFKYVNFINTISIQSGKYGEKDYVKGLEFIDVSRSDIDKCVEDSFVEPGNYQSENKILKEDRYWQSLMRVTTHP